MGQLRPDIVGLGDLRRLDRAVLDPVFRCAAAGADRAARREARADPGFGAAMSEPTLYGIVGEFPTPLGAVIAARQLHDNGFRQIEAHTPYPVEELDEVVRSGHGVWLGIATLAGAVFGAAAGTFVQYWTAV